MKSVLLLHNPKAGDEDHLQEELMGIIAEEGYRCIYCSIKEDGWKRMIDKVDLIAVAGGDGSVRTIAKEMIDRGDQYNRVPLTIIPMGTANNLFKSLDPSFENLNDIRTIIAKWKFFRKKYLDVGEIKRGNVIDFFIEGVGFGVFPKLIDVMKYIEPNINCKKNSQVKIALHKLIDIVHTYPVEYYQVKDSKGTVYNLDCILLEIMNIKSVGPNLNLAQDLHLDEGYFDVVYITEEERSIFIEYLRALIDGVTFVYPFKKIRLTEFTVRSNSLYMHIDDELAEYTVPKLSFSSRKAFIEFVV